MPCSGGQDQDNELMICQTCKSLASVLTSKFKDFAVTLCLDFDTPDLSADVPRPISVGPKV